MSKLDFDYRYKQNTKYLDAYEMWRKKSQVMPAYVEL